ncbi:alpha/beta fold hydrolase [Kribbella sp. DT2]|uniref:alpha/beta fold hydrolase n=1 Tax=Kribbella sp. DT2 TaxID=3393427 RepID=UPI003CF49E4B
MLDDLGERVKRSTKTRHLDAEVDGLSVHYREAGVRSSTAVVLLHGFPSSSYSFRDVLPALGERNYVIAPDLPGFGFSDAPQLDECTFERLAQVVEALIADGDALAGWMRHAGLRPADAAPSSAADDVLLHEARALRSLLWPIFDAQADGRDVPVEALDGLLGAARNGEVSLSFDGTITPRDARGAQAFLALRGIGLVLNPPDRPVRRCDRCGWFFLDHSRGRRRRWCSMKTCGNQAKAARYRATHP